MHAIVLLTHFHALSSFVFSCGLTQKLDGLHKLRQAQGRRASLNSASNASGEANNESSAGGLAINEQINTYSPINKLDVAELLLMNSFAPTTQTSKKTVLNEIILNKKNNTSNSSNNTANNNNGSSNNGLALLHSGNNTNNGNNLMEESISNSALITPCYRIYGLRNKDKTIKGKSIA